MFAFPLPLFKTKTTRFPFEIKTLKALNCFHIKLNFAVLDVIQINYMPFVRLTEKPYDYLAVSWLNQNYVRVKALTTRFWPMQRQKYVLILEVRNSIDTWGLLFQITLFERENWRKRKNNGQWLFAVNNTHERNHRWLSYYRLPIYNHFIVWWLKHFLHSFL